MWCSTAASTAVSSVSGRTRGEFRSQPPGENAAAASPSRAISPLMFHSSKRAVAVDAAPSARARAPPEPAPMASKARGDPCGGQNLLDEGGDVRQGDVLQHARRPRWASPGFSRRARRRRAADAETAGPSAGIAEASAMKCTDDVSNDVSPASDYSNNCVRAVSPPPIRDAAAAAAAAQAQRTASSRTDARSAASFSGESRPSPRTTSTPRASPSSRRRTICGPRRGTPADRPSAPRAPPQRQPSTRNGLGVARAATPRARAGPAWHPAVARRRRAHAVVAGSPRRPGSPFASAFASASTRASSARRSASRARFSHADAEASACGCWRAAWDAARRASRRRAGARDDLAGADDGEHAAAS